MNAQCTLVVAICFFSFFSFAAPPSELHSFRINAHVTYRCYTGNNGKKTVDTYTKKICDSKTYKTTLAEKIISIEIKDVADPEKSSDLEGSWRESFEFKGRKFEAAIGLFKTQSPSLYRVRLIAMDNEPSSRRTSVYLEEQKLMEMNPVTLDYSSVGTKEEISFLVTVQPATRQ